MKIGRLLVCGVSCLTFALTASAATITYHTEGSFNGGAFGTNVTEEYGATNGTSIRFIGASGTVDTDSNIGLGAFVVEKLNNEDIPDTLSGTFELRIVQDIPAGLTPVPASLNATLTGTVQFNRSTGQVSFSSNTVEYENAVYRLGDAFFDQPWTVGLVAPSTGTSLGAGVSTLEGTVVATSPDVGEIPEPATYGLLGSGLLAIGLLHRRRS
jgi:hypothetical protein